VPRASDAVDQARSLLQQRLRELDDERAQVEKAIADLGGRRGPGRPRGSRNRASANGRRRRRRSGTRADEAVKMVGAEPGISAGKIAKTMGIAPNYMYRVMGELEKEGRVRKDGRGYHPAK
jgi:predicted Rossmann fold nucleotide-binding protein DprA/Smf involved in DNA uptake